MLPPAHLRALGATVMLPADLVADVIVGLACRPILEASGTLAFVIQFWQNGGSWTPKP